MAKKKNLYGKKNIKMFAVYKVFWIFGSPMRCPVCCWPSVKECREWIESHKNESSKYMVEAMPAIIKAWDGTMTENLDPNIR